MMDRIDVIIGKKKIEEHHKIFSLKEKIEILEGIKNNVITMEEAHQIYHVSIGSIHRWRNVNIGDFKIKRERKYAKIKYPIYECCACHLKTHYKFMRCPACEAVY